MRVLGLALIALVSLTPLIASAQPVNPIDIMLKAGEAWDALKSKDYAGALEAYRQLIAMAERMVEWLESKVPGPEPSASKPVKVGDFVVSVLEVERPHYVIFEIAEGYGTACAPKYRGFRLVAVKVSIRNVGSEEVSAGLLSFRLVTASGRKYEPKGLIRLKELRSGPLDELKALYPRALVVGAGEDYYILHSLPPGISRECWLVFQVPVSEEVRELEVSTLGGSALIRLGR